MQATFPSDDREKACRKCLPWLLKTTPISRQVVETPAELAVTGGAVVSSFMDF